MKRVGHGETGRGAAAREAVAQSRKRSLGAAAPAAIPETSFRYMFPELQSDDANVLPPTDDTVAALKVLAEVMTDLGEQAPTGGVKGPGDSDIPAAYTYFGQFLDHDITFDTTSSPLAELAEPGLRPLANLDGLLNARSARLDLDSVYGGPRDPADPAKMQVGPVTRLNGSAPPTLRPPGKSDANDLPRQPRSSDQETDRAAIIGDPRNDENLIVAQLHTAFLKAHNTLVDEGMSFEDASAAMRRNYHSIVLGDFLTRVCDPGVVQDVTANGPRFSRLDASAELFMPVEFSVAAYRFGHTMIRTLYDFNLNFEDAGLNLLFTFTALSGQLGSFDTLPDNWIIQWERFLPIAGGRPQMARTLDSRLTDFTFKLQDTFGEPEGSDAPVGSELRRLAPMLAMRNLLRGYLFRLPTGQAVARLMGIAPLEGDALIAALPEGQRAAAEPFKDRTPLWFYVLAEAGDPNGPNGAHLGPVGSRIVVETLWTLIERSKDAVVTARGYAPDKPAPAAFTLADLVELAARQDARDPVAAQPA